MNPAQLVAGPKAALALALVEFTSPQRGSHPSKNSTHLQPYRVTTAFAFLAFVDIPHLGTTLGSLRCSRSLTGGGSLSGSPFPAWCTSLHSA
jgi:hypothetical protein